MNKVLCALFVLVLPVEAYSQTETELLEAAKLGIVEKLYEGGGDQFREQLLRKGHNEDEVEDILYEAIDAYAECTAKAANDQALEQGLPQDIILKSLGGKTRGKEEAKIAILLDDAGFKSKRAPCDEAFSIAIGLSRQ